MPYVLQIVEPTRSIHAKINFEIVSQINSKITVLKKRIENKVKEAASLVLDRSPEYQSFSDGGTVDSLKAHFGFTTEFATRVQDELKTIILNSLRVITTPFFSVGDRIIGEWRIEMVPDNYRDVLSSDVASYISQNFKTRPPKKTRIDWLAWLLLGGDSIIIDDYVIEFGDFPSSFSRSRKAKMTLKQGSFWKVPSQYSGTQTDNWLTRTFKDNLRLNFLIEAGVEQAFNEVF